MPRATYLLTADEQRHLQSYNAKSQTLRDLVRAVAHGYQPAVYLTGRAGIGKTHTVMEEVERTGRSSTYRNARITSAGLFELFDKHPDDVIVIDDVASLFTDRGALQILQGALDSKTPRLVTRTVHGHDQTVVVTGGLVAISNVPLDDDPIASSIQSRVLPHEFNATNDEVAAFMKHLVLTRPGMRHGLGRAACLEVVNFLTAEAKRHALWLDLRHLGKACGFYRQWADGHAATHWQDLIRLSIQQPIKNAPLTKRDEIAQQRDRVRRLMAQYPGDVHRQVRESGLSKSTFYARRKELLAAAPRPCARRTATV